MISSGLLLTCQTSRYKLLILLENSNNINECIQISILYKQIDIELIYEYISNIMSQLSSAVVVMRCGIHVQKLRHWKWVPRVTNNVQISILCKYIENLDH